MKKKIGLLLLIIVLLAALFAPVSHVTCKDGGTQVYSALTYRIVKWNRLTDGGTYRKTRVYVFPRNLKPIEELWQAEENEVEHSLTATITEIDGDLVTARLIDECAALTGVEQVTFNSVGLDRIDAEIGSLVTVHYKGRITDAAQIDATSWLMADNLRTVEYTDEWLDKKTAEKMSDDMFRDIVITKIYANCFFANTVVPLPYEIKINGSLSEEWCVGDQVICTCENTYYDGETQRAEADMLTVQVSDWQPEPNVCYKPVIYLYPEKETEVSVDLTVDGGLSCTYPAYQNGWHVTAAPDGTLTDKNGQIYNYLYWEGETAAQYDFSRGFCVKGEDTATFLEQALQKLGLNRREANEFIVYWLPLMEQNEYNVISFQTDAYTDAAQLTVDPAPDTLIRVFMAWHGSDVPVALPEQVLTAPVRVGFTVVEWGGTEIK